MPQDKLDLQASVMPLVLQGKPALTVFHGVLRESEFWEPSAEKDRPYSTVGLGTRVDLAGGGLLDLLRGATSDGESPLGTLTFMDNVVFLLMVVITAQQVEAGITLLPDACRLVTSALETACAVIEG